MPFQDRIELRAVGYRYEGRDLPALRGVDLNIRKGEVIGVVGPSGAGKTTLIDILLGLLVSLEGSFLVDGAPLAPNAHLSAGYVPQEIFLFDDTLRANVAFGVPAEEVNDAEIHRLLDLLDLGELLAQLPGGLDTRLGEGARLLSGGQRQRIGIARALYTSPQLLIMDEATSSMDVQTEERVTDAISALKGKVTILVIAHRLSTVRSCDWIALMDGGRIVDRGSFDELNDRNETFRSMVNLAMLGGSGTLTEGGSAPKTRPSSSKAGPA